MQVGQSGKAVEVDQGATAETQILEPAALLEYEGGGKRQTDKRQFIEAKLLNAMLGPVLPNAHVDHFGYLPILPYLHPTIIYFMEVTQTKLIFISLKECLMLLNKVINQSLSDLSSENPKDLTKIVGGFVEVLLVFVEESHGLAVELLLREFTGDHVEPRVFFTLLCLLVGPARLFFSHFPLSRDVSLAVGVSLFSSFVHGCSWSAINRI